MGTKNPNAWSRWRGLSAICEMLIAILQFHKSTCAKRCLSVQGTGVWGKGGRREMRKDEAAGEGKFGSEESRRMGGGI